VEVFNENKQWSLSTWKYEQPNLFLTCVEGLPGTDRRLLTGTLQFMLPAQITLNRNRWKLIQLLKLRRLNEILNVMLCHEVGRALGFFQFYIHILCIHDICTQEANQMKCFLLEWLPTKSPLATYVSPDSTFRNPMFSPHSVHMHFVWISEQ